MKVKLPHVLLNIKCICSPSIPKNITNPEISGFLNFSSSATRDEFHRALSNPVDLEFNL